VSVESCPIRLMRQQCRCYLVFDLSIRLIACSRATNFISFGLQPTCPSPPPLSTDSPFTHFFPASALECYSCVGDECHVENVRTVSCTLDGSSAFVLETNAALNRFRRSLLSVMPRQGEDDTVGPEEHSINIS